MPGPGCGLGTTTSVTEAGLGAIDPAEPMSITRITLLPGWATKAWLVVGSTTTPPAILSVPVVPFWTESAIEPTVVVPKLTRA